MEVGAEYYLAGLFTERRFAAWHVGEIHVDYTLKPHARRDGFEESPEHEALLEHATMLGIHLSRLCRMSSAERTARARLAGRLERLEHAIERPFLVGEEHLVEMEAGA